ncbi:MAG: hypothetical protein KGL39_46125 [Patescibacteria group bacterium]|nr:hypothetical protein [Patescibacteria group bacterium]
MKLPPMRFTVRRLMGAVLLVAIILGAFEAGRRWERAKHPVLVGTPFTVTYVKGTPRAPLFEGLAPVPAAPSASKPSK